MSEWLPEKGERVVYRLASTNKSQVGVVTGYRIEKALGDISDAYSRIFVLFIDIHSGVNNSRLLTDIAEWDR